MGASDVKLWAKELLSCFGFMFLINTRQFDNICYLFKTETTLNKVEKSSLMLAYEVNAVGPILVIKVT